MMDVGAVPCHQRVGTFERDYAEETEVEDSEGADGEGWLATHTAEGSKGGAAAGEQQLELIAAPLRVEVRLRATFVLRWQGRARRRRWRRSEEHSRCGGLCTRSRHMP